MSENRLFVGNRPCQTLENDLTDLFSRVGATESVNLMFDKSAGKSRGFAFVEFSSPEQATRAVEMFQNVEFQGRPLTVNVARPREERAPREGGHRGDRGGDRGSRGGDRGGFWRPSDGGMTVKNGPGDWSDLRLREYRFDTSKPRQLASAQITRMSENTPSPSGGAVPPKPAEASKVQPKQATVRIALPPKPAGGGATIRLPTAAPAPAAPAPASAGATVRLPTAAPAPSPVAPAAPRPPAPSASPMSVAKPAPAPTKSAAPSAPVAQNKSARSSSSSVSGVDKALSVVAMVATLAALGVVAYLVWGLPTTL